MNSSRSLGRKHNFDLDGRGTERGLRIQTVLGFSIADGSTDQKTRLAVDFFELKQSWNIVTSFFFVKVCVCVCGVYSLVNELIGSAKLKVADSSWSTMSSCSYVKLPPSTFGGEAFVFHPEPLHALQILQDSRTSDPC